MDDEERVPLTAYRAVDCVRWGLSEDASGIVVFIFSLPSGAELAVELPPRALASLEENLAVARESHAAARPLS